MAGWRLSYMKESEQDWRETVVADAGCAGRLEAALGATLRTSRLRGNVGQAALAAKAGVSLGALKNLEGGKGATVRTLVLVARALGHEGWLTEGWEPAGGVASGPGASAGPALRRRAHSRPARGLKPLVRVRI